MSSPLFSAEDLATEISSLPPMVNSLLRLSELVNTSDYSLQEVEEIICLDQSLSMDTLRFANSAESAAQHRIGSIRESLIRLGASRIFQFLFSRWLRGTVKIPLLAYGISQVEFWKHGIIIGLAYADLRESDAPDPADFTVGMLHDIGKVALSHMASHLRMEIDWSNLSDGPELAQAELDLCGMTHGEIGAAILDHWHFPQHQIDTARAMGSKYLDQSRIGKAHRVEKWIHVMELEKHPEPIDLQNIPEVLANKVLQDFKAISNAMGVS